MNTSSLTHGRCVQAGGAVRFLEVEARCEAMSEEGLRKCLGSFRAPTALLLRSYQLG